MDYVNTLQTYGPFVVCIVMAAAGIYKVIAHRRWRRWRERTHALQLRAVADYADKLALDNAAAPGTSAVYWVRPDFDFTVGGQFQDDRQMQDYRAQTAAKLTPKRAES